MCTAKSATNLKNLQLLKYLTYTDSLTVSQRDFRLATEFGRMVIIDDSMPAEEKKGCK